jgi:nitrate/nitrite transporter NarK
MCGTYVGAAAYWTLPRPLVTGAGAAAAIALSNACGNLGGFVGPLFMGIAREHFGNYQAALAVAGAISVAAAAMTFFSSTVQGPRLSDHDDKQTYPA